MPSWHCSSTNIQKAAPCFYLYILPTLEAQYAPKWMQPHCSHICSLILIQFMTEILMKLINICVQIGCQVLLVLQLADLEYIPIPLTSLSWSQSKHFIFPCFCYCNSFLFPILFFVLCSVKSFFWCLQLHLSLQPYILGYCWIDTALQASLFAHSGVSTPVLFPTCRTCSHCIQSTFKWAPAYFIDFAFPCILIQVLVVFSAFCNQKCLLHSLNFS